MNVVIMQAVPGSGKTTAVKKIVEESGDSVAVCSADFYHMRDGIYDFKMENLGKAHKECQESFRRYLDEGVNTVIVDNTNVKVSDVRFYVELAREKGYGVKICRPNTTWANNAEECAKRNVHNVPLDAIKRMMYNLDRFDFQSLGLNKETDVCYI